MLLQTLLLLFYDIFPKSFLVTNASNLQIFFIMNWKIETLCSVPLLNTQNFLNRNNERERFTNRYGYYYFDRKKAEGNEETQNESRSL